MGRQYSCYMPSATLTSNATKSLVLLNPSTTGITLVEIGVSFDNVTTNAEPIILEVYRVTAIGSAAGTSTTLTALDEAFEASPNTALTNLTVEPTTVSVLGGWFVQPNSGLFVMQWPLGREIARTKAAGARIGIRAKTVTGVTPNAIAYTLHEE